MKENCPNCNQLILYKSVRVFERELKNTPYLRRDNAIEYMNIYFFFCKCSCSWYSIYFQVSKNPFEEKKAFSHIINEIKKYNNHYIKFDSNYWKGRRFSNRLTKCFYCEGSFVLEKMYYTGVGHFYYPICEGCVKRANEKEPIVCSWKYPTDKQLKINTKSK